MTGESRDRVVAAADEIPDGDHVVVECDGREVGVFNVDGEYHAYANWCPHHGAPVCEGAVDGTTDSEYDRETLERDLEWVKEGQVLRCPWHAWEFDVTSGDCLHSEKFQLAEHDVRVEDGEIVLTR